MKLRRISNFHFKMLYLATICAYNSFRDDFEWYGKMADIAKNALYVPSFRVWLTFQDSRSRHTVSVQISPPQYSMRKIAFSASETTILPTWSYLLHTPVYLMSILCAHMKLPRNANFHLKMLNLANIWVYYAFRHDLEWFGKMSHITKNAL